MIVRCYPPFQLAWHYELAWHHVLALHPPPCRPHFSGLQRCFGSSCQLPEQLEALWVWMASGRAHELQQPLVQTRGLVERLAQP